MNIPDEQLTEHFRLIEFVRSQMAERHGINNDPDEATVERLRANAGVGEDDGVSTYPVG